MSSDESRKIPLRIANKRAYVWDVDDIATIRAQHRLCGILTGTLPHLSQQNVFLGVPLVLMPEEVALLLDIGAAVLVDDPKAHIQPTMSELQRWNAGQQELIRTQVALTETKSANTGRVMSDDALRKRKEREERKKAEALKAAENAARSDGDLEFLASSEQTPAEASPPHPNPNSRAPASGTCEPLSSIPYAVVVPASSSSFEWYNPSACSYSPTKDARADKVWDYPSTLEERARCGVFSGLWKQGFFMGGGIKFGGDYLVYPGDPLRYHSHFVASVLESPTSALRPMEIVAHGRLGTATKKAHLLCGWDDEKKEVSYLSIEWAGFG